MEPYIYLTVRIAVVIYLFHRMYVILFKERLFGIWDRIPVRKSEVKEKRPLREREPVKSKVVGKTDNIYLPEPAKSKGEPLPAMSIPLEPSDYIGDDSEDDPPEFEVENGNAWRPDDEDFADPDYERPPLDPELSTGVTYEEIMAAAGFMAAPTEDDEAMMRTARTLLLIKNSDVFDFIQYELSSTEAMARILAECSDENGELLSQPKSKMQGIDITQYDFKKFV